MNKIQMTLSNWQKKPFVMYIFLGIQTLVFLWMQFFGSRYGDPESTLVVLKAGGLYGGLIATTQNPEWWRFVTPIFVHIGLMHFVVNSITLYFLGEQIEAIYGHLRFALIYLLSGIAGNVLSFSMNIGGVSAGASTALFGLFGAFAILRRHFSSNQAITYLAKNYMTLIAFTLIFNLFDPTVDIFGHIGGLIGGVLVSTALAVPKQAQQYNIHERVISGIVFVFLIFFFIAWGFKKYGVLLL
jgi:rhomboid protease GluP